MIQFNMPWKFGFPLRPMILQNFLDQLKIFWQLYPMELLGLLIGLGLRKL